MTNVEKVKVLAFTGRKGSGKDTALKIWDIDGPLRKFHFIHINFADGLKEMCGRYFRLTHAEMYEPSLKEVPLNRWPNATPRFIMQNAASQLRDLFPDIWVKNWGYEVDVALHETKHVSNEDKVIVCTDLRYRNEYNTLKTSEKLDVTVIRIVRNSILKGDSSEQHGSETEVDLLEADYLVSNEGTMEEFTAKILEIRNKWEAKNAKD